VVRSLDQVIEWRGKPLKIRCDHELNARTFSSGGQSHPVTVNCSLKKSKLSPLHFTQMVTPTNE